MSTRFVHNEPKRAAFGCVDTRVGGTAVVLHTLLYNKLCVQTMRSFASRPIKNRFP